MEGPRAPTSSEFTELINFLDSQLRSETQWSVAEEYPTTITIQNLQNFRIIKDENKILSHALVKPTVVKTRRGIFKAGCLGSVVTSDQHRNQGLSQSVLNECLQIVKDQGCDFAILWTNLYDFYRKMGFELAGSEVSLLIDRPLSVPQTQLNFLNTKRVDTHALFRLYSQHSVTTIRTLEDYEKFLKIPNSRLYTAWAPNGSLEAYAIEGKGADLQGYIHEWGGSVDGIVQLTSHIRNSTNKPVTLIAPAHSQNLIRQFETLGVKRVDGYLGMIKIVNPQQLFAKIMRNARQEWGIENFTLEFKDGFYYYGIGENLFKTDREADIVKLLFGPMKPSKLHDAGPEMNAALDRFLPLEMWIWGWDSV